jgi:DNA-binding transcriptional MerR regulator
MPEVSEATYLSIGEVLGLLLEQFPDITISKIRFLESQGLISPERTASGYRKFYEDDVELLKVILTEQRRNYLPLRVIKDRLDSGQIDPTGEHGRPDGESDTPPNGHTQPVAGEQHDSTPEDHTPAEIPSASIRSHPASRGKSDPAGVPNAAASKKSSQVEQPSAGLLPGVLLDRGELCAMVGMSEAELEQLEQFGVVAPRPGGGAALYNDDAVQIARPACQFLRLGVDARHLRNWRTAADREASLYEQLVTPRYRQRNPESRAEALTQLRQLDQLGGELRAALTRQALRHHFES